MRRYHERLSTRIHGKQNGPTVQQTRRSKKKMCYGNQRCPHEIRWGENAGECGKPRHGICIESYETPEEYEAYVDEYEDLRDEYLWEQKRDRELF